MPENKFEQIVSQPPEERVLDHGADDAKKQKLEASGENPEETLRRIRKLPSQERRVAVVEFKKQLAEQKKGLAEIQEEMISFIRSVPDSSEQKLFEQVLSIVQEKHVALTKQQARAIMSALEEYAIKHRKIRETRNKYPDDAELYRAVFNRRPKGEVKVIEGPMALYFRCFYPDDYIWIRRGQFHSLFLRRISEREKEKAKLSIGWRAVESGISGLEGMLLAENSSNKRITPEVSLRIFRHEEQHAMNALLSGAIKEENVLAKLKESTTNEERLLYLMRYFRSIRRKHEWRTKDEVLAFLKVNTLAEDIIVCLMRPREQGGLYDYFATDKDQIRKDKKLLKILGREHKPMISESIHQAFEVEYRNEIEDALSAFEALRARGYSLEQAIAIFAAEPLHKWKKVEQRMGYSARRGPQADYKF